jgi:biopolymer transport protein ExbD
MNRRNIKIPIVAMSDIAFLLLIFLMLSNIISSGKGIKITLPKIDRAEKVQTQKRINIYIDKEGATYLDDKPTDLSMLYNDLQQRAALSMDYVVFIFGDADAEYGRINSVLKVLKNLSLRNCVFVTKEKE